MHICTFHVDIGALMDELIILVGSELPATMGDERKWMYDG
jgi:hypothetical protein